MAPLMVRTSKPSIRQNAAEAVPATLPLSHVAIIMDGNRRWADKRKMPRLFGHRAGVQTLKKLVKHASIRGLKYLTVYAFSSENWQRGKEEVDYLFELFAEVLRDELEELSANQVRLRFIGDLEGMPADLREGLVAAMERTKHNQGVNLQIALNYGSRWEIAHAVREIAGQVSRGELKVADITPETIDAHLYTRQLPDPDLLIRTGGEMRLSNYLLWQSAYTELYVTPVMWPEFKPEDFDKAVAEYSVRQRRYGGD
jgi:undecaprenyl diphosphate synthase